MERNINAISDVEALVREYYDSADIAKDATNFANMTRGNNDVLLQFIEDLEEKQPSDISITSVTFNNGTVSMSAKTSNKQTIAKFIMQLKSIDNVSNVAVNSLSESKDQFGIVNSSFSLTCYFTNDITLDEFADIAEEVEEETQETEE